MANLSNINGKFSVSDVGAVTFNNAFTFPTADGAANYVLQTNGSGQLAWALNGNGDISGSGTANTVTKFTGSGSGVKTIGNGPITFSSNESTFTGRISVTGDISADNYINIEGATNPYLRIQDITNEEYLNLYSSDNESAIVYTQDTFKISSGVDFLNQTPRLTINSSGNATFTGTVTAPTFLGDLNGTINTVTTATTKGNSTNDTTVATTAFVQNVIGTIPAGLVFQGTWNASTNTPTLTSGSGTTGNFYIVSVAGSTNLDGITDWQVGDWAVFIEQGASDQWEKIDNSSVLSGSGTGGSFAGWSGSGTSVTLGNAPVTFSGNNSTFAGNVFARRGSFGTASNFNFDLYVNGDAYINDALTVDDNATFAGIVGMGSTGIYAGTAAQLNLPGKGLAIKNDKNGSGNNWSYIENTATGSASNINFYTGNNAAALTLAHNGNATFSGSITSQGIGATSLTTPLIQLQGNITILNKAQTSYISFATRDTSGSDTIMDLTNVTINGGDPGPYLPLAGGTLTGNVTLSGQSSPQLFLDSNTGGTPNYTLIANASSQFIIGRAGVSNDFILDSGNATFAGNITSTATSFVQTFNVTDNSTFFNINHSGNENWLFKCESIGGGAADFITIGASGGGKVAFGEDGGAIFEGNVGIGGSPTFKLDVLSNGTSLRLNSSDANGSYVTWSNNGTANGFMGSGYHLWSSPNNIATTLGIRAQTRLDLGIQSSVHMTILSSGNIGIGTATPLSKLTVSEGTNQHGIELAPGTLSYLQCYDRATSTYGNMTIDAKYLAFGLNNGTEKIRFTADGYVGIGTTSPSRKLVVAQSNVTEPSGIDANASILIKNNTWSGIQMLATEATGNFITFGDNVNGFAGRIQYSHATNAMQFETVGTERMRIDSSGVINFSKTATTATPVASINHASNDFVYFSGGAGGGSFGDDSHSTRMIAFDGDYLRFDTNGAERMKIASDGSIKYQTGSGKGYEFGASGSSASAANMFCPSGFTLAFGTNNTERMRIDSSGNVGINKTSSLGGHALSIKKVSNQQLGLYYDETNFAAFGSRSNGDVQIYGWNGSSLKNILLGVDGSATGGNVGIGTTSPSTKLNVANAGEVIVRSSMTAADGYRGGFEADNQHTGGTIWSMFSTNNSDGYFGGGKYVIANESMGGVDANTTAKFVIDGSGSVGIGTTSPVNKLNVNGDIGFTGFLGQGSIFGNSGNSSYAEMQLYNPATGYTTIDNKAYGYYFATAGSTKLTILNNGNVGIGTTSPLEKLNIVETTATAGTFFPVAISGARYQADYGVGIAFRPENNSSSYANKTAIVGSGGGYGYNMADLHFCFNNSTTITDEVSLSDAKVTMKRSGNVGIGNTSPQTTLHVGTTTTVTNQFTNQVNASNFFVNGNANGGASFFQCKTAAVNINMMGNNDFACNQFTFYHKPLSTSQNVVGTIATFSSSTQYNTTSDYRLKENVIPLSDSIIRLKQLKPSRFNFIEDPERTMDGFLAHEVQNTVPEAVNGEKDAVDENGNEVHQGIDQAKIVPLLVAAVQEQQEIIESLKQRIEQLEN